MSNLAGAETQTVGALGARLYLDSGTLRPLLKRMEAGKLVERRRDPADERRVLVGLTEQGKALRGRSGHVPETVSGGYTPAGIEELRESVRGLVAILAQRNGRDSLVLPNDPDAVGSDTGYL